MSRIFRRFWRGVQPRTSVGAPTLDARRRAGKSSPHSPENGKARRREGHRADRGDCSIRSAAGWKRQPWRARYAAQPVYQPRLWGGRSNRSDVYLTEESNMLSKQDLILGLVSGSRPRKPAWPSAVPVDVFRSLHGTSRIQMVAPGGRRQMALARPGSRPRHDNGGGDGRQPGLSRRLFGTHPDAWGAGDLSG